jgi:hypothetical protein
MESRAFIEDGRIDGTEVDSAVSVGYDKVVVIAL